MLGYGGLSKTSGHPGLSNTHRDPSTQPIFFVFFDWVATLRKDESDARMCVAKADIQLKTQFRKWQTHTKYACARKPAARDTGIRVCIHAQYARLKAENASQIVEKEEWCVGGNGYEQTSTGIAQETHHGAATTKGRLTADRRHVVGSAR